MNEDAHDRVRISTAVELSVHGGINLIFKDFFYDTMSIRESFSHFTKMYCNE